MRTKKALQPSPGAWLFLQGRERLQRDAFYLLQEQARQVMTLSEVEPRVQQQGKQYEGAKGSLQGAMAAVVSELLSKDKYTHAGAPATLTTTMRPAYGSPTLAALPPVCIPHEQLLRKCSHSLISSVVNDACRSPCHSGHGPQYPHLCDIHACSMQTWSRCWERAAWSTCLPAMPARCGACMLLQRMMVAASPVSCRGRLLFTSASHTTLASLHQGYHSRFLSLSLRHPFCSMHCARPNIFYVAVLWNVTRKPLSASVRLGCAVPFLL